MRIETNRLILREWKDDDAEAIAEALIDFETAKKLSIPCPYTLQNAKDFIKKMNDRKEHLCFAITLKESGKVIGSVEAGGIWLSKNYQGKGYGTEAFAAISKFTFDIEKLNIIKSGYFDYNKGSENLHKKLGFKNVGERIVFCPTLNSDIREIRVELSKKDFEKFYNSQNFTFKIINEKTLEN